MRLATPAAIWFVYMLECRDGTLYTGVATDVERRFAQHLAGKGARYTRAHAPARILATTPCVDRSHALRCEYRLKQLKKREKLAWCEQQSPSRNCESEQ